MNLTSGNLETLVLCSTLTALAAALTAVLSVICGASLALHARANFRYGASLAILFVPFAIGSSVWAYSVTRLAIWCDFQSELVSAGTFTRASVLLLLSLARTLPLGTFFCATSLQRYTSEVRPYFQTHHLRPTFFLICVLNRIPKSIVSLLGLFGGALMASETALPIFLYRANPGTGPETTNIMLARSFREIYASVGPDSLARIAILGALVSLVLLGAALLGTFAGRKLLSVIGSCPSRFNILAGTVGTLADWIPRLLIPFAFLPGCAAFIGLFLPIRSFVLSSVDTFEAVFSYWPIVSLGFTVGVTVTVAGIAIAIRLRYSQRDLLALLEKRSSVACLLLLPAFVPVLSVIAVLGTMSHGQMAGIPGYASLFISHLGLHYSVFQFICMALIAAIPERHVAWQRTMRLHFTFSLMTDGFRRHAAVIVALIGLGTVQVVTDGSVSRWFSHLVKAPEEALYAAVFGRLSSATEAAIIAWSVAAVATSVCVMLAAANVRDLKGRHRYA